MPSGQHPPTTRVGSCREQHTWSFQWCGNTRQVGVTHVAEESSSCIHDFPSCLQALLSASWPPRVLPARSVTSAAPGESGYWNFGERVGNPSARSSVTDALPQLCASLNGSLCQLFPGETWNALCVSRNILTSPHKDTANLPGSSNLTVG